MDKTKVRGIKKSEKKHRVERPAQTGFSSPATHYGEPRIDLNDELVTNSSATFFVRVADDAFTDFDVFKNDVLIVDKSRQPQIDSLVLAISNGSFDIVRIEVDNSAELVIWGTITYIIKALP